MNFVSRGVVLMALFGAASSAFAGSISLQYLINTADWNPTVFNNTGAWDTSTTADILIPIPGLQIPGIQQAFIQQGVPLELRGDLTFVTIQVDGFTYASYTLDNNGGVVNAGVGLTGTLTVKEPVTSAPVSFPSGSTTILSVVSSNSKTEFGVPENAPPEPNDEADFVGADTRSGTIDAANSSPLTGYASGPVFDAFDSAGTVYLPINFAGSAFNATSGNFEIQAFTYGAARVTITYNYLPESEWAWAGLPFVAGGWLVRRRLAARSKN